MNLKLVESCYENSYGIDIASFHAQFKEKEANEGQISYSDISSKTALVSKINDSNRIVFQDGKSKDFKLVICNGLIYLLGENSCYPCSHVVETRMGEEFNWVRCFVIPQSVRVIGECDIRKSAIIPTFFDELIQFIDEESVFFRYLDDLKLSFGENPWFKNLFHFSKYIQSVKFWSTDEKIKKLHKYGRLNCLETIIYSKYKKIEISREKLIDIYIRTMANSSKAILSKNTVSDIITGLPDEKFRQLFAIDLIERSTRWSILDDSSLADLLEIDTFERHGGYDYTAIARRNGKKLFNGHAFPSSYQKLLKENFRKLENDMRANEGYKFVGEFYSEELFGRRLREAFFGHDVVPQYSPSWLYPQRIDFYFPDFHIGIEYNGEQHYRPINFFGGAAGFEKIRKLDDRKRVRCVNNGVQLLEVRYDEDLDEAIAKIARSLSTLNGI